MMRIGPGAIPIIQTEDGGIAIRYINKTGALSVKGTLVNTETLTDFGVITVSADEPDISGVIFEDGIPDGDEVLVVIAGKAKVLLEDTTAATRGYWARVSTTQDGRADITNAAPPGGTINAIDAHFREIGHCHESVTAGTDKLATITLHFN